MMNVYEKKTMLWKFRKDILISRHKNREEVIDPITEEKLSIKKAWVRFKNYRRLVESERFADKPRDKQPFNPQISPIISRPSTFISTTRATSTRPIEPTNQFLPRTNNARTGLQFNTDNRQLSGGIHDLGDMLPTEKSRRRRRQ